LAEKVSTSRFQRTWNRFTRFSRDIKAELKRVIWPTKSQLINNTISVLIVCLLIGILIWVADAIFSAVTGWILVR
jgi:preprotein translocase subunit SecE